MWWKWNKWWKFKFFFSFIHLAKIWYAKSQLSPSNQKTFFIETYTIQYKTDSVFKKRFAQFPRKITAYADILMMYINLPGYGHIQEFTNEFFVIAIDSALILPWLVKKSNNK